MLNCLAGDLVRRVVEGVLWRYPTSASWINNVEGFFARPIRQRLKRGFFNRIVELQAAINRYLAEHNQNPRPFVWLADPDGIVQALASVE
jgi:hypothetical protein